MKTLNRVLLSVMCVYAFSTEGLAQGSHDEVYLKDGSLIVGTIIELKPNVSVSIRTPDGKVRVIGWEQVEKIVTREQAAPVEQSRPAPRTEGWYISFNLGYAISGYPDWLQSIVDDLKSRPDASQLRLGVDFGLYLPLRDKRTIVGCAFSGYFDRYNYAQNYEWETYESSYNESVDINQFSFSVSAMHFLGEVVGDGFFVRGDAGFSSCVSKKLFIESKDGIGLIVGGGYGIPLSDETRVLIQAGYSYRHMGGGNYSTFNVSVGGLF